MERKSSRNRYNKSSSKDFVEFLPLGVNDVCSVTFLHVIEGVWHTWAPVFVTGQTGVSFNLLSFWECLLFSSIASDRPVSPWLSRILLMRPSISHKCTAVMDVQALPTSFISVLGSNLSLSVVRSYHPSPKIKQTDSSFFYNFSIKCAICERHE